MRVRQLGSLEAAVMHALWQAPEAVKVRDVLTTLDRTLAYTTVMTVLDNLHRKGLVNRTKVGRAYTYAAALSREEHSAALLSDVLSDAADRDAALLHLVGQMSAAEAAHLRTLLDARVDDEQSS